MTNNNRRKLRLEEGMTKIILRGCNGKMGSVVTQMVEEDETSLLQQV